jgi:hypothetical protein
LRVVSLDALHLACVISGLLGVLLMFVIYRVRRRACPNMDKRGDIV